MGKPKPPETLPSGQPVWGRNAKGEPICAKRKKNGELCQQTRLAPNGRCKAPGHGGNAKGAPIKHGGRSVALRSLNLADKFQAALDDPELASHRENTATLEVLIQQRLERAAPTQEQWTEALRLYDLAMTAEPDAVQALKDLGPLLRAGLQAELSIAEAVRLMDHQRRHKLAESKREAELQATMSPRQASAFILAIAAAAREEILDEAIRRRFTDRVLRLCSAAVLPELDRGYGG